MIEGMELSEILQRIAQHDPLELPVGDSKRSAVLVPFRQRPEDSSLEVILTRRSAHLPSHGGQVSFPGGGRDARDRSAEDTALRELQEELGLTRDQVEVIGRSDDMLTVTGYHVVPVVGLVDRRAKIVPDEREVARVFSVPLEVLWESDNWRSENYPWKGSQVRIWRLRYDGEDIWGATAVMLRRLVAILGAG